MDGEPVAELPIAAIIDFELRERPGRVYVRYGLNDDPARWGYPLLGIEALVERSRGFPVVQAEVEYPAHGYGAVMGWVQLFRSTFQDTGERQDCVDVPPQLEGLDLPYLSFGTRPVLFDAPSTTANNVVWNAHALLVFSPDCLMSRNLHPVCGFAWGYGVTNGQPQSTPLVVLDGRSAWREDLDFLRQRHPSWRFEDDDEQPHL